MKSVNQVLSKSMLYLPKEDQNATEKFKEIVTNAVTTSEQLASKEMYRVSAHRNTIAVFKALVKFHRPNKEGKLSVVRYNLEHLDADAKKAYHTLENSVRKLAEDEASNLKEIIMYVRDESIPDGTPRSKYTDVQAFPSEVFRYSADFREHTAYLQKVKKRIATYQQFGYVEQAEFLHEVFNRALDFC